MLSYTEAMSLFQAFTQFNPTPLTQVATATKIATGTMTTTKVLPQDPEANNPVPVLPALPVFFISNIPLPVGLSRPRPCCSLTLLISLGVSPIEKTSSNNPSNPVSTASSFAKNLGPAIFISLLCFPFRRVAAVVDLSSSSSLASTFADEKSDTVSSSSLTRFLFELSPAKKFSRAKGDARLNAPGARFAGLRSLCAGAIGAGGSVPRKGEGPTYADTGGARERGLNGFACFVDGVQSISSGSL